MSEIRQDDRIHEELIYILWCQKFAYRDPSLCSTIESYNKWKQDSKYHVGDCTLDSCPCTRCHHQELEIEAQKALNWLDHILCENDSWQMLSRYWYKVKKEDEKKENK